MKVLFIQVIDYLELTSHIKINVLEWGFRSNVGFILQLWSIATIARLCQIRNELYALYLCANSSFNLSPSPAVAVISWSEVLADTWRSLSADPLTSLLHNLIYRRSLDTSQRCLYLYLALSCSLSSSDSAACLCFCCRRDTNTDKLHTRARTPQKNRDRRRTGCQALRQTDRRTVGRAERNAHHHGLPWQKVRADSRSCVWGGGSHPGRCPYPSGQHHHWGDSEEGMVLSSTPEAGA